MGVSYKNENTRHTGGCTVLIHILWHWEQGHLPEETLDKNDFSTVLVLGCLTIPF